MSFLLGFDLAHRLAALQLFLLHLPFLFFLLLLLVYLYILECAFLDDLLLMLLALLQSCFVLAVPLQVVHAVFPALVLKPKLSHFFLQVLELMPLLHDGYFSAALRHVLDGPFN